MIVGKKYLDHSIIYTRFKKHACPECGRLLSCVKVSKIVNTNDPEAKRYDFSIGDTFLTGDVKFVWTEFRCSECRKKYSVNEMRRIEKERR